MASSAGSIPRRAGLSVTSRADSSPRSSHPRTRGGPASCSRGRSSAGRRRPMPASRSSTPMGAGLESRSVDEADSRRAAAQHGDGAKSRPPRAARGRGALAARGGRDRKRRLLSRFPRSRDSGGPGARIELENRPSLRSKESRPMQELEKIWMNGELIDWADAKVHVGTHGLHYGSGVFEGIRAYETPKGSAVFRLTDHLQRLHNSAQLLNMELGYTIEELHSACIQLIGANGVRECYLRPIAFFGYGELGVAATGNPIDVVIMSWPWGTYLGAEGMEKGITAK